ncbi:MAG: hypothetical protein RL226_565 [Bacteroidota bacterium]
MEPAQPIALKSWISAMRLRTLPLSFSAILAGSAMVHPSTEQYTEIVLMALCTTFLLQVLSNFANDLGDYKNGADSEDRIGPKRAVQSGVISPEAMMRATLAFGALSLISGILLLFIAFPWATYSLHLLVFLGIGTLAILAAYHYTAGRNPYGYKGLGDVSVFFFFGIAGVAGTAFLLQKESEFYFLLPAAAIGSFATAVLNLNNMRDVVNDAKTGKITLVVRLGAKAARKYHTLLFLVGWLSLFFYGIISDRSIHYYLVFLWLPVHAAHLRRVFTTAQPQDLDPELKKIALSTFGISLTIFLVNLVWN